MKRGVLKDLANTPTQILCGWRLYGTDLLRLRLLAGQKVDVDLLTGHCESDGVPLEPPLTIAADLVTWVAATMVRARVPRDVVSLAAVTLRPTVDAVGTLAVGIETIVQSTRGNYESRGRASWHASDVQDVLGLPRSSRVQLSRFWRSSLPRDQG